MVKINVCFKTLDNIILEKLSKYNFSMSDIGTHYYKDIIKAIIISLKNLNDDKSVMELREEIFNPYSQFYFNIINDEYTGINELHSIVYHAFVNRENINKNDDYMSFAFSLANSILLELKRQAIVKEENSLFSFRAGSKKKCRVKVAI